MKTTPLFKEARRLHKLGFAIHWLKPKSKMPIESGWTTGPRKEWDYLKETYIDSLNVGVRLGTPSKIGEGYLCVIDVDVKSKDKRHKMEAVAAVLKILGDERPPMVESGRGNGSRHYYVLSREAFKGFDAAKSKEIVKTKMPSASPSKRDRESLSEKEISQGYRMRPAWEISIMSEGRQVVLPPSIHPDTGEPYTWSRHLAKVSDLPFVAFEEPEPDVPKERVEKSVQKSENFATGDFQFTPQVVDIDLLPLSQKMLAAIKTGEGVSDRSAYLLPAASALVAIGLTQDEVLSVLTNRKTYLGECAYDHAKTSDQARAAYWVWKYTLARVQQERKASNVFSEPVDEGRDLTDEELAEQESKHWARRLERTAKFQIKNNLKNCKMILENVFGHDCLKFNEFSMTEEIHGEFPWLASVPKEAHDIDVTMAKDWFTKEWGYEPSDEKIRAAMSVIAFENRYHPVREWLEALPSWDGKDRCDNLLATYIPCTGDEELRQVAGRRFLVALIKRIYEPGCQSDYLMVLEGLQGIQKSSAFRALVGDAWFSDASFNVEDKDAVMVIFSKWLIEFGELSTLDKATAEHTKAFISRRNDRIRAPFDRKARDYPRQCLFVGSTNKDQYLKDDTGNRRFWPFKVDGLCNVTKIARDREQLFAEALLLYQVGEPTYLKEPELEEKMRNQQGSREMHDLLTEQVEQVVSGFEKTNGGPRSFQMLDLFATGKLNGIKLDQYGSARIGAALRKLGFEKARDTHRGDRPWLWSRAAKAYVNGKDNHQVESYEEWDEREKNFEQKRLN